MYSNLSQEDWEKIAQQARAKALADKAQIIEKNKALVNETAKVQAERAAGLVNDNLLNALTYGAKTGANNLEHSFDSAWTGLKHTGAELFGMDDAANSLAEKLRQNAQAQAQRQAEIDSQYNTNFGMLAKGVSDITSGAIGMLPTIGAAVLTPQGKVAAAGKVAQIGGKALRALPSTGVLGVQTAGSGINQALNEGAEINEAKKYGVGSAVKEVATELPFAGIAKVPGLVKVNNGIGKLVTEGAEEALAEYLDPYLQRATYNPNAENASWDDMLYSALIGAGTAGLINSGFTGAGKAANMALGTGKNKKMLPTAPKNVQNQGESPQNAQNGAGMAQDGHTTEYLPRPDKTAQNQFIEVEKIRKQMEKEQAELLKQKNALWKQKTQMEQAERDNLYREIKNLEETINLLRGTQSSAFDDALFNAMDEYTAPEQKPQQTLPTAKRQNDVARERLVQELSTLLNDPAKNMKRINEIWARLDEIEEAGKVQQEEKLSFDMPMSERTLDNVSNPKVKAYQSTHPEVKAFFREQAEFMLNDLNNMIDGGREYGFDPETRNVTTVRSQSRAASSQIERLLNAGMTKAQIRDGLERIIRDNGAENTANAKKVETTLDDALANGYQSMQGPIPKNLDYVYNNADIKKMQNAYGKLNSEESFANAAVPAGLINELQYLDDRITERQQLIDAYSELLPDMSVYETMTAEELHNEMAKLENASQYAPNEIAGEMMARHRYLEILEEGRVNEFVENENIAQQIANLEMQLKKLRPNTPLANVEVQNIQKKLREIEAKQAGISIFNKDNPNAESATTTEQFATDTNDGSKTTPSDIEYEDADISGVDAGLIDYLEELTNHGGVDVRVVQGMPDNMNGRYRNGIIELNANRVTDRKTLDWLMGHELYHSIGQTKEAGNIQGYAVQYFKTINPDITGDILVQLKMEEYAEAGIELTVEEAWEEIGAEFMEIAIKDTSLMDILCKEQPTLAQQIFEWIQNAIRKLTGKAQNDVSAQQLVILEKAREQYAMGLRGAKYNGRNADGKTKYMFAGENSRTADHVALARAKELESQGTDMETIRQETGWFKSKVTGDKWAYEISDKGVEFSRNAPRFPADFEAQEIRKQMVEAIKEHDLEKYGQLQKQLKALPTDTTPRRDILMDWMSHPELYEAYPELRNMPFKLDEDIAAKGSFDGRTIRVKSSLDKMYTEDGIPRKLEIGDTTNTMLHEIQHAIQKKEGFPKGSSVEGWESQRRKEAKKASLKRQEELAIQMRNLPKSLLTKENLERGITIEDKANLAYSAVKEAEYWEGFDEKRAEEANKRFDRLYDEAVAGGYDDLFISYIAECERYDEIDKSDIYKSYVTNFGLYENTAGEIMARDTMQRSNLDAEQRKQKQPKMGDENTVYADSSNSHSVGIDNDGKKVVIVDRDIYNGKMPAKWTDRITFIEDELIRLAQTNKNNAFSRIMENGHEIYLDEDPFPGEYVKSIYSQNLKKSLKRVKFAATGNLHEIIEIAQNRRFEGNKKGKNSDSTKDKRKRGGIYKYDTSFAFPDSNGNGYDVYDAELVIRRDEDGRLYLYDIVHITERGLAQHLTTGNTSNSGVYAKSSFVDGSIPQTEQEINTNRTMNSVNSKTRLQEMVEQYGAIPKGEDPYGTNRDVEIPRQVDDDTKVSRWGRTAAEAAQINDETEDALEQQILSGKLSYAPSSNQEQIARANRLVAQSGWEQQTENFRSKYRSGEMMTADDIALGEQLILEAQAAGDTGTAVELIADVAALGTELGRAVQALSLLKRMTPQGKVMALKRLEQRLNANLAQKDNKFKNKPLSEIQAGNVYPEGNKGVASEVASQQNFGEDFLQVKIPDELLTEMLQARGAEQQAEAWDKCVQAMADQVPATLTDKVNAWRYLAMLSNPKTHIRNLVGNSVMLGVSGIKRGIQKQLENRLLTAGEERYAELNRNVPQEYFEFAEWSWENEGKHRAKAGGGRYNDAIGQIEQNKPIFKTPVLEKARLAVNGPEGILEGTDMMFKKKTYIDTLARYMYANGLSPSVLQNKASNASYEKGTNHALNEAFKGTFQEASKVANLLSQIEHSSPVAKLLMGGAAPFKKTPINILKRGVEYSPVGLLNGLIKMRTDVQNGKMTPAEAIDSISAGLTGTGIMILGYFMASMGWLTAGAGEDDERKQWYDQSMGSQNYALVLPNGGTATIDWLAPSVMPLMAGAELFSQRKRENPANENSSAVTATLEAISKVANPVLEMSMLQGVTDALQSYNSGTTGVLSDLITSTATSYGGQFIPAPVGAMARTMDDTVRSSYAPKDSAITKTGEKFIRQQVNKLPFASMTNEASIDVWGNEVKRAGGNIVGRAFNNFLNPATYSSDKRTELDKKLNELYEATGNSGVLPKSGTTYINESDSNPKVYLSAKEYAKYGTTRGQNSYQYVNAFVNSSAYSQLADEDKAEIISNLYDLANYQAKKEALNGRGYNYVQEQYEKVLKSKMEPQKYYIAKYNMDLIADNVTTGQKKEQISYLKGLQQDGVITDEQCWYLRRAMIGKFSKSEMAACPYAWIKQL